MVKKKKKKKKASRLSTACIQNFFLLLNWYETFILGLIELHM